jgi:hypothetical protein
MLGFFGGGEKVGVVVAKHHGSLAMLGFDAMRGSA